MSAAKPIGGPEVMGFARAQPILRNSGGAAARTGRARIRLADRPSPVLKLQAREASIKSALRGEAFVGAFLDDAAAIEHQNAIA